MAYVLHRPGLQIPVKVASTVVPKQPVQLVGSNALLCTPVGSCSFKPFGVAGVGTAVQGEELTIYEAGNYVKVVAAASVGVAADVGVASSNGACGPIAQASGTLKWVLGTSVTPADAGETFTIYVNPRQLGGNQ